MTQATMDIREGYREKFGFHDDEKSVFKTRRGLDKDVVAQISEKTVRAIAWDVIPDLAEALIKQEIERLKAELRKI